LACLCRYRKLKQLRSRNSQADEPLTLLCKDENTGLLAVIHFLRTGSNDMARIEQEVLNMRMCSAHPYIVHLRQVHSTLKNLEI
jgi:hypothetical protein